MNRSQTLRFLVVLTALCSPLRGAPPSTANPTDMNSTLIEARAISKPDTATPSSWERLFSDAPATPLVGLPGEEEEALREPASVKFGVCEGSLWAYVIVQDDHLYNTASNFNDLIYRFGDTIEVFLEVKDTENYLEFHFSPSNQRLQLDWNEENRALKSQGNLDLNRLFIPAPEILDSFSSVNGNQWQLLVRIPTDLFGIEYGTAAAISVSVCRYNYHTDGNFTLSSTSPHKVPNFHEKSDWLELSIPVSEDAH
tara:strand:- start:3672 stop:4433 length:762 start_codon:yes stop_codon:yes gene_type:complete